MRYIISLGSNLGNKKKNLSDAIKNLSEIVNIVKKTEVCESEPYLDHHQPAFANQGLLIDTDLEAENLWDKIEKIEQKMGRKKTRRYGPRLIDIDLIWCSEKNFQSKKLTLPHPGNSSRPWVRNFIATLQPDAVDAHGITYRERNVMAIKSVLEFHKKKALGEKITMLTAYDFSFASILANTSIDCILVGDSLGNTVQGKSSTLEVTIEDVIYHTQAVRKAMPDIFIVADMPFMSYQTSPNSALTQASRLIREGKADAVKLEGASYPDAISSILRASIPVMGHLGLTPQSIKTFGGYKVQGRGDDSIKILQDAHTLENLGIFSVVLEGIPATLGKEITQELTIPTIGIGAGSACDGQVLVLTDMLGMTPWFKPKFVRNFANLAREIEKATEEYCKEVRSGGFPNEDEIYK